jgi:ABC-type multidrug transport system fused ATPase/permease subunit
MNSEFAATQTLGSRDADLLLSEIKDEVILLSMANEYICEDPYLKKIGFNIQRNIELLKSHIQDLRRQFVGKFVEEINLDEFVDAIAHVAKRMQEGENGVKPDCVKGELGKELGEKVVVLVRLVKELEDRVTGRGVSYTRTDSFLGILDRLRFVFNTLIATYSLTVKIFGLLVLLFLIAFSFLAATMETEKHLLKEIEEISTHIQSSRTAISQVSEEAKKIQKEIDSIRAKESSRQKEIELIDLNLKAFNLAEELQKRLIEVKIQEKTKEAKLRELDEMRQKSLLARLIRR